MRLVPALLLFSLAAVAADTPDPAAVEHFERSVRPVLVERCGACHIDKAKGGLKLTGRESLLKGGDLGPAVVPGDPAKSLLLKTLTHAGELKMPPDGKLKAAEIEAITKWVKDGAAWPATDSPVSAKPDGPLFTKEQKEFWAFQPVRRPDIPANPDRKGGGDNVNPIDAFVQDRLAKEKLTFSPPADKRALLRRAHFDLTGLPPTPEQLAAFEKDTAPDAFARVVDDLLASPHYGERWGRHWLDVARYADTNGMDENTLFGNAWKYRDYVVSSFNADTPYDQFLREQIAGDLLPDAKTDAERKRRQAALGFLALGPKLLAEPDKQKMLLDIADEQLDTLGKSVMGLTLGCARCHDHKFDPLPTRDYYSLLAVFTSTRTMQNLNTVAKTFERTVPDTPAVTKARKELADAKKEVVRLEAEFGKVPETDKEKRREIHEKAEVQRAIVKKLEPTLPPTDAHLGVEEGTAAAYGTQPRNLFVQVRGNYTTPGAEAPAVFPRILAGEEQQPFVKTTPTPAKAEQNKTRFGGGRSASGRLELANWLADPKHPLTARVMVNRIWLHHFGEGLVRTPDNFGRLGERPTHPELLDWLAAELVSPAEGKPWALKRLHKLILLSKTYQQSAGPPPQSDAENKLLSVFPRRRLDAESIRDAMLSVSGKLDPKLGSSTFDGPNLDYAKDAKYDTPRRSLYLPVVRGRLFPFFQTFDFPDPGVTVGKRATTTVAPQALWLLNSPFVREQADALAAKVLEQPEAERANWLYRRALLRSPTNEEVERMTAFVAAFAAESKDKDAVRKGWAAATQAVLAGSEFLTVE